MKGHLRRSLAKAPSDAAAMAAAKGCMTMAEQIRHVADLLRRAEIRMEKDPPLAALSRYWAFRRLLIIAAALDRELPPSATKSSDHDRPR